MSLFERPTATSFSTSISRSLSGSSGLATGVFERCTWRTSFCATSELSEGWPRLTVLIASTSSSGEQSFNT